MLITIITVCVTIASLLANHFAFRYRLNRKETNVRKCIFHGIGNFIIVIVSANICLAQFEFGRAVQDYMLKNAAFLVAIFSFSMQQVLSDLIGGMMVAWSKPYDIGERINLATKDITGIVEDITIRHTVIKCYDNTRLIIPNSVINKEILRNADYEDCLCGNFVTVTVAFDSDLDRAILLMKTIIYNDQDTLYKGKKEGVHKELDVQVSQFNKEGIELKAIVWTPDTDTNFAACSRIRKEIWSQFKVFGIQITSG